MVSLVPIITVEVVGLIYDVKSRFAIDFDSLDDSIVDYDWEVNHG